MQKCAFPCKYSGLVWTGTGQEDCIGLISESASPYSSQIIFLIKEDIEIPKAHKCYVCYWMEDSTYVMVSVKFLILIYVLGQKFVHILGVKFVDLHDEIVGIYSILNKRFLIGFEVMILNWTIKCFK